MILIKEQKTIKNNNQLLRLKGFLHKKFSPDFASRKTFWSCTRADTLSNALLNHT